MRVRSFVSVDLTCLGPVDEAQLILPPMRTLVLDSVGPAPIGQIDTIMDVPTGPPATAIRSRLTCPVSKAPSNRLGCMQAPYRITTVCTGNICRSPMAEFMLRNAFEDEGLNDQVEVDSAATSRWEIGSPIDRRAAVVLSQHGLSSAGHTARQFDPSWFASGDLILALDDGHLGELREWAPDADSAAKIHLLREFDPEAADDDLSIPDPWYGSSEDFERTWDLISAAIPGVLGYVEKRLSHRTA